MNEIQLVKHASGAPGLRFFGFGPKLIPKKGILKLKSLLNKNTLWAKKRSSKNIKTMLSNSNVIVSAWKNNKLIGFGRATSDEIYRAVLWDVVVDLNYQKSGLGTLILKSILENRLISKVERIYLMTTNCVEFYSKMGFATESDQTLMVLKRNI